MRDAFASDRKQKTQRLVGDVDKIAAVVRGCGANSEELGALSAGAAIALPAMGMVKLKFCAQTVSSQADPATEMMVLEELADLEKVSTHANGPAAAISFFFAGPAVRHRARFHVGGRRRRCNSGIRHTEWWWAELSHALMHKRYARLYHSVSRGRLPDGAAIVDLRAICVYAPDAATETATMCYHFFAGKHPKSSAVCCATSASPAFSRR